MRGKRKKNKLIIIISIIIILLVGIGYITYNYIQNNNNNLKKESLIKEINNHYNKFVKTNNIIKLEKQIKLLHRKLSNIRNNHIHQATNKIIKLKQQQQWRDCSQSWGSIKNIYINYFRNE